MGSGGHGERWRSRGTVEEELGIEGYGGSLEVVEDIRGREGH